MGELIDIKDEKEPTLIDQAEIVIKFLNEKTGKNFLARNPKGRSTTNSEAIIARLNEGYTVQNCKTVIARKTKDWLDDDEMSKYLTPQTLFRRSKFEKYFGECT